MKILARMGIVASALIITSATFAADLPAKKQAPAAMPMAAPRVFSWNGVYGGFNGGFGSGNFTSDGRSAFGNPSGGLIGFTGGYNYQMPNNWVVGIEGDIDMGNIKASNGSNSSELRYMNTFRGRLGYATDRILPYVTAGYAGGTTHDDYSSSTTDNYHNGWTAGAGIEMAITDSWSIKGEGLYVRLEDKSYSSGVTSGADLGIARIGLNYRF
jgi:outer membrane immunogenic protein